ncbi:serine/threonine-protein kinase 17B isoform X3 [Pipistrellus kuhlii]|uniref:serine/threonine-protein kinase 17B isoform X3 n=1 Tax=Pipistrellus kuhlii TaxID=59472 RepID=UPI00174ECFE0|nr:serine/threonine-protein kinase 17B isoform X3 [Pipistrellus kuhlii]
MSRRRFDCRSVSGLLTTTPQTPMKMENFNNFYTLTSKELGRGKFAVVRQCISKSTGQEYAAKFLKKRRRGQDCRAEILHEIAVLELARSCPHVINLHEVYENTSEIILVLEYAAGGEIFNLCLPELAEMVSESDIIRLIKQILEGVCYLHQNNIVHLDLKPQNILLSSIYPLGDIKIVDFGMSRKLGNACELREIMGTPEYLAPEILNYDPITTATDMWKRPTAEICLTHSWLQQWDFGNLLLPEEMSSPPQGQDHTTRSPEDKTLKSSCNGTCEDREDKENIPEDSSVVSKRFRFDDSLPSPHELVPDVLC